MVRRGPARQDVTPQRVCGQTCLLGLASLLALGQNALPPTRQRERPALWVRRGTLPAYRGSSSCPGRLLVLLCAKRPTMASFYSQLSLFSQRVFCLSLLSESSASRGTLLSASLPHRLFPPAEEAVFLFAALVTTAGALANGSGPGLAVTNDSTDTKTNTTPAPAPTSFFAVPAELWGNLVVVVLFFLLAQAGEVGLVGLAKAGFFARLPSNPAFLMGGKGPAIVTTAKLFVITPRAALPQLAQPVTTARGTAPGLGAAFCTAVGIGVDPTAPGLRSRWESRFQQDQAT